MKIDPSVFVKGGDSTKQFELLRLLGANDEYISFMETPDVLVRVADAFLGETYSGETLLDVKLQTLEMVQTLDRAIELLPPHGWAVPKKSDLDTLAEVVDILDRQKKAFVVAETILVRDWNKERVLERIVQQVGLLGAGHDELWDAFRGRERLLGKALTHHRNGSYEASIPLVLAQIDGITCDISGNTKASFFSNGSSRYFEDADSFLGVRGSLKPLQKAFTQYYKSTAKTGQSSRHGILHGRELAYDTLENSTKLFVLLAAIAEWARPKAIKLVDKFTAQRQSRYAGTRLIDEDGRQLDRRYFAQAKEIVDATLNADQMHLAIHGCFCPDHKELLGAIQYMGLSGEQNLISERDSDLARAWYWVETPSGFCLGTGQIRGEAGHWKLAQYGPPVDGPLGPDDWRHSHRDAHHVDW